MSYSLNIQHYCSLQYKKSIKEVSNAVPFHSCIVGHAVFPILLLMSLIVSWYIGAVETGHLRTRWSSLDFGGELDVERREDFFWSSPIFSVETETGNCGPPFSNFWARPCNDVF